MKSLNVEIENIFIMFIFLVLLTCTLLSNLLNGVTLNSQKLNKLQVVSVLIRWSWKKFKNQQVVGGDVYLASESSFCIYLSLSYFEKKVDLI